jgi:DNA-binding transcriptional MocR family regulator
MICRTGPEVDGRGLSPLDRERLIYAAPNVNAHGVGVLLAINHHMRTAESAAWPSQSRLADMVRVSTKTVKRAVRDLRDLGYISTDAGRRAVLTYQIDWAAIEAACRTNRGLTDPGLGSDSPMGGDAQSPPEGLPVPPNRKKNRSKNRRENDAHARAEKDENRNEPARRPSGIVRAPDNKYATLRPYRAIE